jgi:1,4-alpha-glucan branching enzyme
MRKNTQRMMDLAVRFTDDTGLKARTLNLAAKEILLSQASDWPAMIHDKVYPDYAKEQFIKMINEFSTVYDSLGSNSISTEWLTRLEREHNLFPWINYKVFAKKK